MPKIYEPKGKAREYSPLALNHYSGCDHKCLYCYVPIMKKKYDPNYDHDIVYYYDRYLESIRAEAKKHEGSKVPVLLSFSSDPYCHYNDKVKATREVLKILLEHKIPVSILTKGGKRCLQDMDIFKQFGDHIQVGTTLSMISEEKSKKVEPGASLPKERIETLKILKGNKIKTWVSFEPVIYPEQTIDLIKDNADIIDLFKIGKLNHFSKQESKINWSEFLEIIVRFLRHHNKRFYIKSDLAEFSKKNFALTDTEIDQDFYNLKPFEEDIENKVLFDDTVHLIGRNKG